MSDIKLSTIRFLLFMLLVILAHLSAFSQAEEHNDSKPPEIKHLDLVQIPDFGKNTRTVISDIALIVTKKEELDEVLPGLESLLTILNKKDSALSDTLNVYRLDALDKEDRELALLNQRITQWKTSILDLKKSAENKDSVVVSMVKIWQLTLDSIHIAENQARVKSIKTENSNDIKTEIDQFVFDLKVSQKNLSAYLLNIRNIQTKITIAENKLGNISNLIESRRAHLKQGIWLPDYPPVWKVKRDTINLDKRQRIVDFISTDSNIIQAFLNNNPTLPYYLAIFILLVFGILIYLKPRAASLYIDFKKDFKEATILLKYPLLSAMVITWFFSVSFSFFPRELRDLFALLMFLPIVILLKRLNPKWKWHTISLFSLSYLLFLVIKEIDYSHLPQRIFLILLNIFTISHFLYYKQHKVKIDKSNDYWFGTLPFIINVFIIIGIVSFIASISGSIQLAQLLTYVTLGMIVVIHVLKTAILLVRSLFFLILMGPLLKHSYILKEDGKLVLEKMNKIFMFIGNVFLIYIMFEMLNIRKDVLKYLSDIINYQINMGEMSISLGSILAFFLTIQIAIWISSLIRYVLEKEVFPRSHLKQGVPNTILLMTKFTVVLLGILFAFSAAGISMDKLAIALGAIGVGIGFGLQGIISNFISGIILALERPITIGDLIEIPGVSGVVKDIGIRASTVRTWDGSDVIVPNAELISNKLTNWTFYDRLRRVKTEVRVPFDTNIEAVSQLLLTAASKIDVVMKKPKPYLNFKGIGTSAMEITLYCWINDSDKIFSYGTAIRKAVYKALQDAGYDMPVPRQELKIANEKEEGF